MCLLNFSGDQKFKKHCNQLSISWLYLWLQNFSGDRKSKMHYFWLLISWKMQWSRDRILISWKKWLSISWLFFRSPEKNDFRSDEIRPHGHSPNRNHLIDLPKKIYWLLFRNRQMTFWRDLKQLVHKGINIWWVKKDC